MTFGHYIPMYSYLLNMILVLMKLYNPKVSRKSSVKALQTSKNEFHVMKVIYLEICTRKKKVVDVTATAVHSTEDRGHIRDSLGVGL